MQPKGQSRKTVLDELKKAFEQDQKYDDGRILCSMCTKPPALAKKAHEMFLNANLGDPGLFPGSAKLEKEAVGMLAALLNGGDAAGFLVSGGTEANLLALLAARNMAGVEAPEVVLPESVHFSFEKICCLLKIKPVYAGLDERFRVDCRSVEKLVNKNTVAIVGSAGSSELGVVDPIRQLSVIAKKHGVWLHVDAAFGGLVIPFLKKPELEFDFQLEAVQSVTVDPHKMGLAPVPAGGILFRNTKALNGIKTETPYLTNGTQYTFVGTRTGASAASTWAIFKSMGKEGFQKTVNTCMRNTKRLQSGVEKLGFRLVVEPTLNILAFRGENTKALAERLQGAGWFVSYVPRLDCIRIVVMPHVKRKHIDAFLTDLSRHTTA
ncbi:MAG: tyrosine decarboxylase MfnA [Candidatus Bathyarchaeia archaeon]